MIPLNRLGWVAGVIDLKATVIFKKNQQRRTPQIVLQVETKKLYVVAELAVLTGTDPEGMAPKDVKEWMRRGCSEHCPQAHVPGHTHGPQWPQKLPPMARWTITGAGAAIVLYNVLPYLAFEREYPQLIEQIIDQLPRPGERGRSAIDRQVQRLRGLGWEIPDAIAQPEIDPEDVYPVELVLTHPHLAVVTA